jgi:VWFA-related protein
MRRLLTASWATVLVLLAPAAADAGLTIRNLDTSGPPAVRVTVLTQTPITHAPVVLEDGSAVAGLTAVNLGRQKNIVLAVDHSQSMHGRSLTDAAEAARRFIALGQGGDQFAILTFASETTVLSGFGAGADAASALDGLAVDSHYGTTLYDAIVKASQMLAGTGTGGRVLVLVTDGQETTSHATLKSAIQAARKAHVAVYPVGIESISFSPAPLKRLASSTGGTYHGARSSSALTSIYATISAELERTWQLRYVTAARPGDRIHVRVTAPGYGSATGTAQLAGTLSSPPGSSNTLLLIVLAASAFAAAALLLKPILSAVGARMGRADFDN